MDGYQAGLEASTVGLVEKTQNRGGRKKSDKTKDKSGEESNNKEG